MQVVDKRGRRVLGVDHTGSAHDEDALALLLQVARERLAGGQAILPSEQAGGPGRPAQPLPPVVEATRSPVLGEALEGVSRSLVSTPCRMRRPLRSATLTINGPPAPGAAPHPRRRPTPPRQPHPGWD